MTSVPAEKVVLDLDERIVVRKALRQQVLEFHAVVGAPSPKTPRVPADDRVRLRLQLIREEFFELLRACANSDEANVMINIEEERARRLVNEYPFADTDLVEAAGALSAIAYATERAFIEFGIDSGPVLDEVHRANMAKVGGEKRADGKFLKPAGWTPPDIAGVLSRQR